MVLTGVLGSENVRRSDACVYRVYLTSQVHLFYGTLGIIF